MHVERAQAERVRTTTLECRRCRVAVVVPRLTAQAERLRFGAAHQHKDA